MLTETRQVPHTDPAVSRTSAEEERRSDTHHAGMDVTQDTPARAAGETDAASHFSPAQTNTLEESTTLTKLHTAPLFTEKDLQGFISKLRSKKVVELRAGCGRDKNRLAVLEDGTKVCCRYRHSREARGDLYSYHFNSMMGLHNTPPVVLKKVNFSSSQWESVAATAQQAGWTDHSTISMTLFAKDLQEENFPAVLRELDTIITKEKVLDESLQEEELWRLLQWSDMIVFDFVVGHSDRIFNALFNLQWNAHMMLRPVHNLFKTRDTSGSKLVLVDNESGFWMGYKMGSREPHKFELQKKFLSRMCLFTSQTVRKIEDLLSSYGDGSMSASAAKELEDYVRTRDPDSFRIAPVLDSNQRREFESRLRQVLGQVEWCQTRAATEQANYL